MINRIFAEMQVIEKKQSTGLVGMEFYAYHGFYDEEQKIGGQYTVDVYIQHHSEEFSLDNIENTINYELVYKITKEQMNISSRLIEHLGEQIILKLKQAIGDDKTIKVIIKKHRPPLDGVVNYATFEIEM